MIFRNMSENINRTKMLSMIVNGPRLKKNPLIESNFPTDFAWSWNQQKEACPLGQKIKIEIDLKIEIIKIGKRKKK